MNVNPAVGFAQDAAQQAAEYDLNSMKQYIYDAAKQAATYVQEQANQVKPYVQDYAGQAKDLANSAYNYEYNGMPIGKITAIAAAATAALMAGYYFKDNNPNSTANDLPPQTSMHIRTTVNYREKNNAIAMRTTIESQYMDSDLIVINENGAIKTWASKGENPQQYQELLNKLNPQTQNLINSYNDPQNMPQHEALLSTQEIQLQGPKPGARQQIFPF